MAKQCACSRKSPNCDKMLFCNLSYDKEFGIVYYTCGILGVTFVGKFLLHLWKILLHLWELLHLENFITLVGPTGFGLQHASIT